MCAPSRQSPNFLWPCGPQASRLPCPWDSAGKNTRVGCHALLPGILPTWGWNPHLLHCRQILYPLGHLGSPIPQTVFFFFYPAVFLAKCFLPLEGENEPISKTNDLRAFSWGSKLSALHLSSSLRALKQQQFSTRCNKEVSEFDHGGAERVLQKLPCWFHALFPPSPRHTHIDWEP